MTALQARSYKTFDTIILTYWTVFDTQYKMYVI